MKGNAREDARRTLIRELVADGRFEEAWRLLRGDLLAGEHASAWSIARNMLRAGRDAGWVPATKRQIRLAVLCTYEAAELSEQLRVACFALGDRR